ncbi:MAG: carboxypeptidase regulatory-like domain-containing protein, partial [Roseiflexaceae bacterium]
RANTPEIYDPAADTWTEIPTATKDLGLYPQMYVLPNGKIFKAGTTTSTYLLDTATGTWTNGPTNAFGSSGYAESSAMYAPGKIIRSGGGDPAIVNTAIVDMTAANPQWKQTSSMNIPRRRHNMVILADGEVMAVGGTRSADDLGDGITTGAVYEAEIWNPATELWTVVPRMTNDRMYHSSAMLLPDGRVLTAGGENAGRYNAQIYSPPYLFKGARPVITSVPATVGYGAGFSVGITTDGSAISSVALIDLSAVTHAFNHNQRYVPLTFSQAGNTLTATAPPNANYAPPGFYMLVVKDSKGVPSVAKFVRVDSAANLVPGTLTGKVTDSATSNPIQGATVAYAGGSTSTDAGGNYTFNNVAPGEVLVTFSKIGYATISRTQTVAGGATATLNVALTPPGTIVGKVTDSSNSSPIAGATVLYNGGSVTTDASGNYTIASLPAGSQTLVASADGYTSSPDQVVNVPANGTATANIALTPKPTYIAGEVRNSVTNETVAGVTIAAGGVSVTTDDFGRYQLFVPPGTYSISASKSGYADSVHNAIVTFGSYTAIDFSITPSAPAPAITAFTPAQGAPGTEVTITGSGFTGATNVKFGDFEASSFTIDSDTQIRAIVPTDAVSGNVTVVTGNGTAISAASFVVSPAAAPQHWVYLPLQVGGGGANVSNTRTNATVLASAFAGNVRAAGNLRTFICTQDL